MSDSVPLDDLPVVRPGDLLGTWHIVQTNFPMWLNGRKLGPTLNYHELGRDDQIRDVVRYRDRRGRIREILGVDTQDPATSAHFTWRGAGLLALLRSDWYVVHLDAEAEIAAIYFTRTLFTPRGMDIIARAPRPDAAALEAVRAAVRARPGLQAQVDSLVTLDPDSQGPAESAIRGELGHRRDDP